MNISQPNYIVFRCDSSLRIGTGHVMRCRTLARYLQKCGANIVFLCRPNSGDSIRILAKEFLYFPLYIESDIHNNSSSISFDSYSSWLGCSQDKDSIDSFECLQTIDCSIIRWIIVDHYSLDSVWNI